MFSYSKTHQLIPEELGVKSTITTAYMLEEDIFVIFYFGKEIYKPILQCICNFSINVLLDALDSIVTNTVLQVGVYLL